MLNKKGPYSTRRTFILDLGSLIFLGLHPHNLGGPHFSGSQNFMTPGLLLLEAVKGRAGRMCQSDTILMQGCQVSLCLTVTPNNAQSVKLVQFSITAQIPATPQN